MAYITSVPLFKNTLVGTQGYSGTAVSDPVDLREIARSGAFAFSYSIASTNATAGDGTAGSSTFEYLGSPTFDGTYIALGTFGTQEDDAAQSGVIAFSPVTIPFMKIKAVVGTSNPIVLTGELNVR